MKPKPKLAALFVCITTFAGCRSQDVPPGPEPKPTPLGDFEIDVRPIGPSAEALSDLALRLSDHAALAKRLAGAEFRVLEIHALDELVKSDAEHDAEPTHFESTLYDYTHEQTLLVRGRLDLGGDLDIREYGFQPPPTRDEFEAAVAVLRDDRELGGPLREGLVVPYQAMPGIVEEEADDGSRSRVLTIGLLAAADHADVLVRHGFRNNEIVGVSLAKRTLARFSPERLHTLGHDDVCEPPPGSSEHGTRPGAAGRANITVRQNNQVIWTFEVIRPASSAGTRGSGVELRNVRYKGTKVLARAHVPILNVHYRDDVCGPYRDWQNDENPFEANGSDVTSGIRICPTPARTIIESGSDQGNFSGVAIWVEAQEVVLASEMEAGWYRYISKWRLHANGRIKPQFGFAAVSNSCTCQLHFHNCYWRLDFDIAGAGGDTIEEYNNPPITASNWHAKSYERMRLRSSANDRRWRVKDSGGKAYTLIPGANDGTADAYARGDAWFLRYHSGELDDGHNSTGSNTEADLDKFDQDENLVSKDVVLWYAAHFSHDAAHSHATGTLLGPTLEASGW